MKAVDAEKHQKNLKQTAAATNLLGNLTRLRALTAGLKRSVASLKKRVTREPKKASTGDLKGLQSRVPDLSVVLNEHLQIISLTHDWIGVLLVTFIEAYLEDNFRAIAKKNPLLLMNKDASLTPLTITIYEANSIEELKTQLEQEWANKMVKGGPEQWLRKLKGMGANGFPKDCSRRLQNLWDTRNLIVHAQGIASPSYVKKYGESKLKPGDRISVRSDRINYWLEGVSDLLEHTESFFEKYPDKRPSV